MLLFTTVSSEAGWLIYYEPELKGTVLDIDTKQPIEGALVVVEYSTTTPGIGAGRMSSVINARETLTDKEGHFQIPSYITIIQPLSWKIPSTLVIYKPGYIGFPFGTWHFNGEETKEDLEKWAFAETQMPKYIKFKLDDNGVVELSQAKTSKQEEYAGFALLYIHTDKDKLPIFNKMKNAH